MITDKQLVDTFLQNRSEEAFKDLYRAKSPGLYQFALRLCKHEELANELLQETWVKAIQNLPNFQWKSSLRTWLTGILINTERELLRKGSVAEIRLRLEKKISQLIILTQK